MTQSLLLPIDDSPNSLRALDWVLSQLPCWKTTPALHLLNVQPSLHGDISRFVSARQIEEFHRESGDKALAAARQRLAAAGIEANFHVRVGETALVIEQAAHELGCTQIVLGTRGHSGLGGLLLGSVATRLSHISTLPLTLIR